MQLQKLFEAEILLTILKSLNNSGSDIESILDNIVIPSDNTDSTSKLREKRSLGLLSSLLGSSSGGKSGGGGGGDDAGVRNRNRILNFHAKRAHFMMICFQDGGGGSGSGSILQLLGPLLGSSSGGGGVSTILRLQIFIRRTRYKYFHLIGWRWRQRRRWWRRRQWLWFYIKPPRTITRQQQWRWRKYIEKRFLTH